MNIIYGYGLRAISMVATEIGCTVGPGNDKPVQAIAGTHLIANESNRYRSPATIARRHQAGLRRGHIRATTHRHRGGTGYSWRDKIFNRDCLCAVGVIATEISGPVGAGDHKSIKAVARAHGIAHERHRH